MLINRYILFTLLAFFVPSFSQAHLCHDLFSRAQTKQTPLSPVDELILHSHIVSAHAPHQIKTLERAGIDHQIIGGIQHLVSSLKEITRIESELKAFSDLLTDPSTGVNDRNDLRVYREEVEATLIEAKKQAKRRRDNIINHIKVNILYPEFKGVYIDFQNVRSPNGNKVFIDKLVEIYQALALERGWKFQEVINKEKHTRILIPSKEALSHLIGEIGMHTWNATHGEYNVTPSGHRDGDQASIRHTLSVHVTLSPYSGNKKFRVNESDFKLEQFNSAQGAGGQKRNKTANDVRLTHEPTGIRVEVTEGREQSSKVAKAKKQLTTAVSEHLKEEHEKKIQAEFYNLNGIDIQQVARAYHLSQGVISGAGTSKITGLQYSFKDLPPEVVFPSIQSNSNDHLAGLSEGRVSNVLSQVFAIESDFLNDTDISTQNFVTTEVDELTSALRSLDF